MSERISDLLPPSVRKKLRAAEAASGATTPDAQDEHAKAQSMEDEAVTAAALGGCGSCSARGVRSGGRYCSCGFGRRQQRKFLHQIQSRFPEAGVPDRLRHVTLESLAEVAGPGVMGGDAVRAVRHWIEKGWVVDPSTGCRRQGICILGPNGRGKSGLLTILARHAYKGGLVPLWIKHADLVRGGVQAGYGEKTTEGVEVSELRLQTAQRAHMLCLDDLGDPFASRRDTESQDRRSILFRILSTRHERQRVTHMTANFGSLGEIARGFDPRTADRIKEMCAVVQMDGQNLRDIPA